MSDATNVGKRKEKMTSNDKTKVTLQYDLYMKLEKIQKQLEAPKNQYNSFGKYKYRSCEDILEGIKKCDAFKGCTIVVSDEMVMVGDRYYVKATATLSDGKAEISNTAYARESEDKKGMDQSQVTGATSSYARKYALNGLFAIDDTKDADSQDNRENKEPAGNTGSSSKTPRKPKPASEKQHKLIFALGKSLGHEGEDTKKIIKKHFKLESFNDLTSFQASKAIDSLQAKIDAKKSEQKEEKDIDIPNDWDGEPH